MRWSWLVLALLLLTTLAGGTAPSPTLPSAAVRVTLAPSGDVRAEPTATIASAIEFDMILNAPGVGPDHRLVVKGVPHAPIAVPSYRTDASGATNGLVPADAGPRTVIFPDLLVEDRFVATLLAPSGDATLLDLALRAPRGD